MKQIDRIGTACCNSSETLGSVEKSKRSVRFVVCFGVHAGVKRNSRSMNSATSCTKNEYICFVFNHHNNHYDKTRPHRSIFPEYFYARNLYYRLACQDQRRNEPPRL